jgi:hypothetical protein
MNEKSKYNSPFSVGKRQTVYVDENDPRIRGWKAGLYASRLGSELEVVSGDGISKSGVLGYLKGSTSSSVIKQEFDPTGQNFISEISPITNLSAEWVGDTLTILFDFDFSNELNKYVLGFQYYLTSTFGNQRSAVITSNDLNKNTIEQTVKFTIEDNQKYFGFFRPSFTLLEIQAIDSFGNLGQLATLDDIPEYVVDLCIPEISANSIPRGYSVNFLEVCEKPYEFVSIEEVVSNNETAPTTGYQQVYLSSVRPATIITPTTETRWIRARYTKAGTGLFGSYSNTVKVTPESIVFADTTGPDNVANVSITSGIDTTGYLGFNAFADISWPAVTGGGIRGYRIRFSNDNNTTYSYVDSPGEGTTYRLGGLAIGATYKIAVATYDEFNNLSSSFVSGPDVTVIGTPSVSNYITGGPFEFGVGVGGVATNKGLYFDTSNYWYVNATNSARLKVGGTTSNYLEWDGATFAIDGNLTARQGTFAGNVSIIPGGSLISGTSGAQSVIVNSNGLSANNSNGSALTEILTKPITFGNTPGNNITNATELNPLPIPINFFTKGALIGGWVVGANTISDASQQFLLDSTNKSISITGVDQQSTNYRVRFGTAFTGAVANTINIFEAGTVGAPEGPNFYITTGGILNAIGAVITGNITATEMVATGSFNFANGILKGTRSPTTSTVDFDLSVGNSLRFLNMPANDDDGWAGDPTITLRNDDKIVKGRRLIFDGAVNIALGPANVVIAEGTNVGTYFHQGSFNRDQSDPDLSSPGSFLARGVRNVKVGDLILVEANA